LELNYAKRVLEHIYKLWGRNVHLETVTDGEKTVMSFDGQHHEED
jgi:stage V sporulation protein R